MEEKGDHWARYNQQWLEKVVSKAPAKRKRILGFVGVMSVTAEKRELMRAHWFPPNKAALDKYAGIPPPLWDVLAALRSCHRVRR